MFLGFPDGIDKRWASSLKEAQQHKTNMLCEYAGKNFGRNVLIYAIVPPNDVTVLVEES